MKPTDNSAADQPAADSTLQNTALRQGEMFMAAGTYTDTDSRGVYLYAFDTQTGRARRLSAADAVNPSFVTPSTDGTLLYTVSELTDPTHAAAATFSIDRRTGMLAPRGTTPVLGGDPCYITADPQGRFIVTANYSGGSMTVLGLDGQGIPDGRIKVVTFSGSGADTVRQAAPHIHCTRFTPDGRNLIVTDLGCDCIYRFPVMHDHPESLYFDDRPASRYELAAGSGPRHIEFTPDGRYAYSVNELSGMVTPWRFDGLDLQPNGQYMPSDTTPMLRNKGCGDIHCSPDGRFLYSSNRVTDNSLSIFAISDDGSLEFIGRQPTAAHPRNFALTPDGGLLLAACRDDNAIDIYARDVRSGQLTLLPERRIALSRPVCIRLFE